MRERKLKKCRNEIRRGEHKGEREDRGEKKGRNMMETGKKIR